MSQVLILYSLLLKGFLDPEKKLFSHRILSRDECIDPFSKTGNLRYVCESSALNKTGQRNNTVSLIKFTFSVVNMFLILICLLNINTASVKLRCQISHHFICFCSVVMEKQGCEPVMLFFSYTFYSCNNFISVFSNCGLV